jgi:hypothetical protein
MLHFFVGKHHYRNHGPHAFHASCQFFAVRVRHSIVKNHEANRFICTNKLQRLGPVLSTERCVRMSPAISFIISLIDTWARWSRRSFEALARGLIVLFPPSDNHSNSFQVAGRQTLPYLPISPCSRCRPGGRAHRTASAPGHPITPASLNFPSAVALCLTGFRLGRYVKFDLEFVFDLDRTSGHAYWSNAKI